MAWARRAPGNTGLRLRPSSPLQAAQATSAEAFAFAAGESFTFEFWVKAAPSNASGTGGLLTKGYAESQARPWILFRYLPPGYVDFYLRDVSGTSCTVRSTQTLNDDRWHHVVGVYDAGAGALRLYIDGALDGAVTGVPAAPYGTNAGRLTIGNHLDRSIDLAVDEVGVYRGVLSEDRIAAHFAAVAVASEPVDESDGRHFVLSLDGASHAELPYDPAHDPASITVELLARVTGGQETWRAAVSVSGGDASQRLGWFLGVDNEDRWCAQIPDGSGGLRLLVGPRVYLGEWTSIAFTHGGGVFELFVAGHSAARAEGSLERSGAQTPVIIGALIADGLTLNRFRGQLTELRIWNGVLTVEQLAVRLAERAAGDAEGLVALLPLNERDGREARNLVAGGPAATLTGGAWEDAALLEDLTPEETPPEETPPEETPPEETVPEGPTEPYIVVSIEPAAAGDARVEIFSGDDYSGSSRTLDVGSYRGLFLPRSARIPKGWTLRYIAPGSSSSWSYLHSYSTLNYSYSKDKPEYIVITRSDLPLFASRDFYGPGRRAALGEGISPVSALGFSLSDFWRVIVPAGYRVLLCSEADGAGETIALEEEVKSLPDFPTAGPATNAQSILVERRYLAIPDAEQHYTLHTDTRRNLIGVDHNRGQQAFMYDVGSLPRSMELFVSRWRFVPAEEPGWYLLLEPQFGFALTWSQEYRNPLYARPRVGEAQQHFRLEPTAHGLILRCREGNTPIVGYPGGVPASGPTRMPRTGCAGRKMTACSGSSSSRPSRPPPSTLPP